LKQNIKQRRIKNEKNTQLFGKAINDNPFLDMLEVLSYLGGSKND
jgi:hypothetical protein